MQTGAQRTINCSTLAKTMELIVDFKKKESKTHFPVYISGAEVEEF